MRSTDRTLRVLLLITSISLIGCTTLQPDGNQPDDLSFEQRSCLAETCGDSLAVIGLNDEARGCFIRAALLRTPEDSLRHDLIWKAADVSDASSVICAQLLLEQTDSLAPYKALQLGGHEVGRELISYISIHDCVMPEYLYLALADSLIAGGEADLAMMIMWNIPEELPETALRSRTIIFYRALLETGRLSDADSVFQSAETSLDDELLSLLCHYKGAWMLHAGISGYREVFQRAFELWPAAPVHAHGYDVLREFILNDRSLAAAVADPFYSGGLWNELYDIAVNSPDPDPHLWYLAARTRDRLGFYETAVEMLQQYSEKWPTGSDTPDAMIYLGRNLGRSGNWQRGLEVLEQYASEFPDHHRIGNYPWYMGNMLVENRQWQQAIPWFRMTLEKYPFNVTADDAHFYLCFCLMKTGRISDSMEEFSNFISRWTGSVYLSSAKYWLGKLLLAEGNPDGNVILEQLIDTAPASLPANFARELLGKPAWKPDYTEESLIDWMTRHGHPPAHPPEEAFRGLFLQEAGLRHFADGEFRKGEDIVGGPDYLAPFYLQNGVWERRPLSGYLMWDLAEDDNDRPRELWMLRYQMAWPELVVPAGEKYGMDSLFAWAIIRNESMFQPDCYSTAGARGLIQMIPSTSEYVALEQGWNQYSPDRLYDPAVSIEYGICYIAGVLHEFGGNPVKTAAAYNAGPHNAIHWGAIDMETDEFFSLITYNETKTYAQNVYHAYIIYRALYLNQE